MVSRTPRQDDVWLVTLDPTRGAEIKKTRPCLIVSPDEMNDLLQNAIVAPMTTTLRSYPTRVGTRFQGKSCEIALDQIRSVARERFVRKLGVLPAGIATAVSATLVEMFGRES